ncbi:scaffolding protein [Gordonia phage NosilaM]|uniref:Scaffolding protein n=1 Tax=Gordonia phage NosilaM TaxID=2507863 RepID=A0A410TE30_9CAUD|nr:head scaffolding protein [Gordonia phage NosilaM]QAU07273.1 scaffolding protein [Gordonia phage NosilaM]
MKYANKSRIIAAAIPLDGLVPFSGRPARAGRAIPRRDPDPNEHGGKDPKDKDDPDKDNPDDDPSKKTDDDDDPKPIDVTQTQAYKDEKARADKAERELNTLKRKGMSQDEQARADELDAAVNTAVSAKEVELTDHYEGRIAALQEQIIETAIDNVFASGGLQRKDYDDVIATLDKTKFVKDDGSVDREKVTKALSPITRAATSRPPRTTSGRSTGDRGFGRYLPQND